MDDDARLGELLATMTLPSALGRVSEAERTAAWREAGRTVTDAIAMIERRTGEDGLLIALALHEHPGALARLDELLLRATERCATRSKLVPSERAEVAQRLRARLLLPRSDGTRSLETYEGRAPLLAWLNVCAAREAAMLRRAEARFDAQPLDGERMLAELDDPELGLLKARDQARLKAAFQRAIADLSSRDKLLLAYQVLDGLGHRRIAALVGLDASNVCRRLASIRRGLLERATAELAEDDPAALSEMYSLARSRLELSLSRLLRPMAPDEPPQPLKTTPTARP